MATTVIPLTNQRGDGHCSHPSDQWAAAVGDGVRVSLASAAGSQLVVAGGATLVHLDTRAHSART
eukprot:gene4531-64364_t